MNWTPVVYDRQVEGIELHFADKCSYCLISLADGTQHNLEFARDEDAQWSIKESNWHLTKWHAKDGEFSVILGTRTYLQKSFNWLTTLWLNVAELEMIYQQLCRQDARQSKK